MEELREQPTIMPATALNPADDESAMSEVGSQDNGDLGKFKNVQALMDAYNNLQSEFTKKCQMLSQLQKDKTDEEKPSSHSEEIKASESEREGENALSQFLENNSEAKEYLEEIKERYSQAIPQSNPYQIAWADVLLKHMKKEDKSEDPIINQYVLSDENVRNKIIENYLKELSNSKPPLVISDASGERVSGIIPERPKTLAEAKKMVDKMFS